MSENSNPLGTDGGGIDAAATAFAGILGDIPKEQEEAPQAEAPEEPEEAIEDAEEGEQGDEAPAEDDAEPADDEDTDEPTQTRKFTVKIDGKSVEVDESELVQGYQRKADYTRKTQELAAQRQQAQEHFASVAAERQKYAEGLSQLSAYLQSTAPQPPSADLLESDPVEYLKAQRNFEDHWQRLQAVQAEQAQVSEKAKAEQAQAYKQTLAAEAQRVLEAVPEWKDPAKATEEKRAIASWLLDAGYTKEDLNGLSDSRALLTARKAMLYDKLIAKKPGVEKRVAEAPKVQKPGQQKTVKSQGSQRHEAKVQRLAKTGRVEDAAAIFRDML